MRAILIRPRMSRLQLGSVLLGIALVSVSLQADAAIWKYVDPVSGSTVYASKAPPKGVKSEKVELPNYAPTTSPGGYESARAGGINSTLPIPLPFAAPVQGATSPPPQALPPLPGGLNGMASGGTLPTATVAPVVGTPSATPGAVTASSPTTSASGVIAVPAGPVQAIR